MCDTETDPEQEKPESIWRYVRLQHFTQPRSSARETARKGFLGLRRWFRRSKSESDDNLLIQEELQRLPEPLRNQIAPNPQWNVLRAALDDTFQDWLTAEAPPNRLPIVITMPGSGQVEALTHWAHTHNLFLLEPPPPEQLLAGDMTWLDRLPQNPAIPMVMPALSQCYLRHAEGLRLIRQFLYWLTNWPGRCLLGCSSWAWVYLSQALHIDTLFADAWTLDALNGEGLQSWFNELACDYEKQPVVFRQADNGHFVIPPPPLTDDNEPSPQSKKEANGDWGDWKHSPFLTDLAAYSRGNPGVAWAIWRYSLGQLSEAETAKHTLHEAETVWVNPWQRIRLPTLPGSLGHSELFVMHALLLQDGLTAPLLSQLLPLSPFEIQRTLTQLANVHILEETEGLWQVSPLAYQAVRETLADEGFLIDEFVQAKTYE